MTVFIGIDPGAVSGAIAAIDERGRYVGVFDMPTVATSKTATVKSQVNPLALSAILIGLKERGDAVLVAIERVASRPGQGVASTFGFGDSCGCIRAVVALRLIPCEFVTPQAWKRPYGLDSDKELARAKAIQLFPEAAQFLARKKDTGRAEALLLAEFLRRKLS
ncbi:MAG: hypothetical protein WCL29_04825 [Pseudomonadota bacterium]